MADQNVVLAAKDWLQDPSYGLILIHLDQVDYAGHHEGGPLSAGWNAAASRVDAMIGDIANQLDLTQNTLLVVADHGQIDQGGHGGTEMVTRTIPFVAVGKGIRPGTYPDAHMEDFASTVSVLLGLDLPASSQGQPLFDLLAQPESGFTVYQEALGKQQNELLISYAHVLRKSVPLITENSDISVYQNAYEKIRTQALLPGRIFRALLASALLAIMIFGLSKEKKSTLSALLAVLVYTLGFHLKYAVADHLPYTLSWIPGEISFIITIALNALIWASVAWLVILISQKLYLTRPSESAWKTLKAFAFLTLLTGLPACLNFVVNGVNLSHALPNLDISYLGLLALVQVLVLVLCSWIFTGLTTILSATASGNKQRNKEPITG
jgi:hypothetical protein